jgi:hypothetical protein
MPAVMESTPEPGLPDSWNFRLYPNPTSAAFTLELAREPDGNPVRFEIYNLMGEIVQKDEFHSGRIHDYSLGNCKPGIYMVRVSQNGITGTGKIIRQ